MSPPPSNCIPTPWRTATIKGLTHERLGCPLANIRQKIPCKKRGHPHTFPLPHPDEIVLSPSELARNADYRVRRSFLFPPLGAMVKRQEEIIAQIKDLMLDDTDRNCE